MEHAICWFGNPPNVVREGRGEAVVQCPISDGMNQAVPSPTYIYTYAANRYIHEARKGNSHDIVWFFGGSALSVRHISGRTYYAPLAPRVYMCTVYCTWSSYVSPNPHSEKCLRYRVIGTGQQTFRFCIVWRVSVCSEHVHADASSPGMPRSASTAADDITIRPGR